MCVCIYISLRWWTAAYCFYYCCFCLRNKSMYSKLSHKFQVFLDNLTDGYYTNIDSDYILTELFNLCNILGIKHYKREQILLKSLYLSSSLRPKVAEKENGEICQSIQV